MNRDTYLITGGTGSFGQAYVDYLVKEKKAGKIIVFSRDEQKHYELMRRWNSHSNLIDFCLGDVRDFEKVLEVTENVDFVIHSAAMKHMPLAEIFSDEVIKTNILGSQNVIKACIRNKVKRVVALSTDKSVLPINVYGASKLLLEKLFVAADSARNNEQTRFSVVRYANVFGSKGSVVPLFLKLKQSGKLPITHPEMSRFSITMQQGIDLVEFALNDTLGGEIVVPIVPSYRVKDIAEAICEKCEKEVIGPRIGEKMHEDLISEYEIGQVVQKGGYYLVTPTLGKYTIKDYQDKLSAEIPKNLQLYRSDINSEWLSVDQIRGLLEDL